jgi:hypothetical protein
VNNVGVYDEYDVRDQQQVTRLNTGSRRLLDTVLAASLSYGRGPYFALRRRSRRRNPAK